jgi:2'-5' RNA ligase
MPGPTRTFIALKPPDDVRESISRLVGRLRGEQDLIAVRWVSPEAIHLTLSFLGDVPEDRLEELAARLTDAVRPLPSFHLDVLALGAFPNPRHPRVLFAGISETGLISRLKGLQAAVVEGVRAAGLRPTDDRFHPHVTLGRIGGGTAGAGRKGTKPIDLTGVIERHRDWTAGSFPVDHVTLFASTLGPGGPVYRELATAPLEGAEPTATT